MPDNPNQPGHFEPLHKAHAIEQVLFIVGFGGQIDDVAFAQVRALSQQFRQELPGQQELQAIALSFGQVVPQWMGSPIQSPAGIVLQRVSVDGSVENELRCDRASITYRSTVYTRWDEIWARAVRYFEAVLPAYCGVVPIAALGTNFIDKFLWSGAAESCRPAYLLRQGSRYISPLVFDAQDLWHSHSGMFLRVNNRTRRLINVNNDCVDEQLPQGVHRLIAISTVLSDQFNQVGYEPFHAQPQEAIALVRSHLQEQHTLAKDILGDIINDEMVQRIALRAE